MDSISHTEISKLMREWVENGLTSLPLKLFSVFSYEYALIDISRTHDDRQNFCSEWIHYWRSKMTMHSVGPCSRCEHLHIYRSMHFLGRGKRSLNSHEHHLSILVSRTKWAEEMFSFMKEWWMCGRSGEEKNSFSTLILFIFHSGPRERLVHEKCILLITLQRVIIWLGIVFRYHQWAGMGVH